MSLSATDLSSHEPHDGANSQEPQGSSPVAGLSPTKLAIRRFRKDRLSMISFAVVLIYTLAAIAGPFLVKAGVLDPYKNHDELLDPAKGSVPIGSFGGISWDHILGVVPGSGTDVLARIWYGITFSLMIALSATIIAVVLGTVLGIISGFRGGIIDATIGRAIDLTLSFPQTLMLLALAGSMVYFLTHTLHVPPGDPAQALFVILVLGFFGWPPIARLVRGQVLSIREREFVEAARALGASKSRIYFKELLPNLWAPILVYFTLTMPAYISAEAALAYLQVSVKPPTPTLGNVLTDSIAYSVSDFMFFFLPALMIAIIVVSFNLFGDGLRDALDPKSTN